MDIDPGQVKTFIDVFPGLSKLVEQAISKIPTKKENRTPEDEEALVALGDAYHATKAYYSEPEDLRHNASREMDIANKWFKVAVLLRKHDDTLANRFDLKSRYWREGATWTDSAIKDAKIGLEDIWRETNARLRKPDPHAAAKKRSR